MQVNSCERDQADLPSFIHQAALDPHLSQESLNQLCDASRHFNFGGFCTSLVRIGSARKRLIPNERTKLIAAIGFPFGDIPNEMKLSEANYAAELGVDEFDVVPNFYALHQGKTEVFAEELSEICAIGLPTRIIIDAAKLSEGKLALTIDACIDAGARGIQTGNGFGPKISSDLIFKLQSLIKGRCSIKAVGGIKTFTQVIELINSGASEIGTSVGPEIISAFNANQL